MDESRPIEWETSDKLYAEVLGEVNRIYKDAGVPCRLLQFDQVSRDVLANSGLARDPNTEGLPMKIRMYLRAVEHGLLEEAGGLKSDFDLSLAEYVDPTYPPTADDCTGFMEGHVSAGRPAATISIGSFKKGKHTEEGYLMFYFADVYVLKGAGNLRLVCLRVADQQLQAVACFSGDDHVSYSKYLNDLEANWFYATGLDLKACASVLGDSLAACKAARSKAYV